MKKEEKVYLNDFMRDIASRGIAVPVPPTYAQCIFTDVRRRGQEITDGSKWNGDEWIYGEDEIRPADYSRRGSTYYPQRNEGALD